MRVIRQAITLGEEFTAPRNITFGYQRVRSEFSVWYPDDADQDECKYIVLGTGHEFPLGHTGKLVNSFVMPDGFEVYHLIRLFDLNPQ